MTTERAAQSAPERRAEIAHRAGVVALGTLGSRVLGAVRDSVIAAYFAVAATDAFFVAFTIPNALRALLGEGAVSAAFVPVFTEVRDREGMARARSFMAGMSGVMLLLLAAVTVLGVLGAPVLTLLYAGGYDRERLTLTSQLTAQVFPYIFFMGLAALATGALNAMKQFFAPAFAPIWLNVAMIAAAVASVPVAMTFGLPSVSALCFGALIGGVLQLAAQLPALHRSGLLVRPRLAFHDPYVRKVFRLMGPLLIGLGVYQVNMALTRLFASFLPEGAQSYLSYGQRLVELPQGMFALAIATATLPTLSDLHQRGEVDAVKETFRDALRMSLLVAIPSSVALIALASPIVTLLLARGSFGPTEALETSRSLVFQAAGIWAVATVRTVVPMFHAQGDTRSPVAASAFNLVAYIGLAVALMGPLGHVGLAIAMTGASVAQLLALLVLLRRRMGHLGLRSVVTTSFHVGLASLPLALCAWGVSLPAARAFLPSNHLGAFVQLAISATVGAVGFWAACKALGVREIDAVLARIGRRLGRRAG